MATFAIGDIQGCLPDLRKLLKKAGFDQDRDRLLLTGDLVARGPDSLGTLRFVRNLGDRVVTVLGNHDLHLLAIAAGHVPLRNKESDLLPILEAPDRHDLLDWLQTRPLLHEEPEHDAILVHAGIPPLWTLEEARSRAREVEKLLRGADSAEFFKGMYGNEPDIWQADLAGQPRWRLITNSFTRMRFVNSAGALELASKGEADQPPAGYFPWFEHPARKITEQRIIFGHWAALGGQTSAGNLLAMDTGCVYGGSLTAVRLDDGRLFSTGCDCYRLIRK